MRFWNPPGPFGADFWVIFGSILEPIWDPNSLQNRSPFLSCFLITFRTICSSFFVIYGSLGSWKKQCKVDCEAMLCNSESCRKTMYFTMKMKGRKTRSCLKNKRERQLDTPNNHSERQAMLKANSGLILEPFGLHFSTENGSKITSKCKSKIETPKVDQKCPKDQNSDFAGCTSELQGPRKGNIRGY